MPIIVLDNVRSVHNVGSIFRTMEGLGFTEIILLGITPTPLSRYGFPRRDFAKTSLGAERTLTWKHLNSWKDVQNEYPESAVYAIETTADAKHVQEIGADARRASARPLIVFGNEVTGVSDEILNDATYT